jgi:hypothetical protein
MATNADPVLVGELVFAAAAAMRHGEYPVDVRMNRHMLYKPHALPPNIIEKLQALRHHLRLEYGAVDMRWLPFDWLYYRVWHNQ